MQMFARVEPQQQQRVPEVSATRTERGVQGPAHCLGERGGCSASIAGGNGEEEEEEEEEVRYSPIQRRGPSPPSAPRCPAESSVARGSAAATWTEQMQPTDFLLLSAASLQTSPDERRELHADLIITARPSHNAEVSLPPTFCRPDRWGVRMEDHTCQGNKCDDQPDQHRGNVLIKCVYFQIM
ncbi:hypothetical protein F2P81_024574 [Scophthalmus maximus]|uniref:Uncharacterized protein n=1 Tax=Scophthalmus maximus TaxID=52904 RepID=A0A6A4S071_SCOMX|nr:hypothetical protein F2P81_024574 [Scophthalmus maximus]